MEEVPHEVAERPGERGGRRVERKAGQRGPRDGRWQAAGKQQGKRREVLFSRHQDEPGEKGHNKAPGNQEQRALAAAGCHIVLFTTGRGTPFGTFVPTAKIATHTSLAVDKSNWIDFNAGTLVEGEAMPDVLERFTDFVLAVASGHQTKNEKSGYRDFAIFKSGVTL